MNKKYYILIIIVLFLIGVFSMEFFIQRDQPKFFMEKIEEFRQNKVLMVSIGGFKSFMYEFNKNQLEEDTLDFKILIEGREENFLLQGKAKKNEKSEWVIFEKEMIRNYEK